MTNEELQRLTKAFIKANTANLSELGVWASKSYIESRRKGETVTLLCQHEFMPDLWVVEHKDGTEGIYANNELARNSKAE